MVSSFTGKEKVNPIRNADSISNYQLYILSDLDFRIVCGQECLTDLLKNVRDYCKRNKERNLK